MSARRRRGPKLVHLSDLHLGFRAFAGTDRGWNRREADLARAFRWAVREIVKLRPDLVLLTGDLFDHPDPPTTAHLTLHRGLQTLRSRLPAATVLAIAGERDSPANPAAPGPLAVLDMIPGVEAAAGAPRAVRIRRLGVHALLVPHRAARLPPFPAVRPDPSSNWNLLLVRGEPVPVRAEGGDARDPNAGGIVIDPAEWDYVAVGGPHRQGEWAPNMRCPGSLERPGRDPWRFATEERGFLAVDLGTREAEFHAVPGRAVVDLAPVRLTPGDPSAGTRRLRELIDGIPAGVDGKIVRARFEGDVTTPDEGVSAALLSAVRRRAAHLEVRLSGSRRGRRGGAGGRAAGAGVAPPALRVLRPDGGEAEPIELERGIVLLTAESEETRVRIVAELGGGTRARRGVGGDAEAGSIFLDPPPPREGTEAVVWGGRDEWSDLVGDGIPAESDPAGSARRATGARGGPSSGPGAAEGEALGGVDLDEREARLRSLRADAIEAFGDLEAKSLEWARERQDAESHLAAYRTRAQELKRRLRSFEIEKEASACPTCGRPMEEEYERVVTALREEWETLLQDGRWWARRREQLEDKPEDLRKIEDTALRLNALVEATGEEIERLRERARLGHLADSGGQTASARTRGDLRLDSPEVGEVLREAGSILGRLTDGRTLGMRIEEGDLRVVGSEGAARAPEHGEGAAILGALHVALWRRARGGGGGAAARHPLLLWEFLETGSTEAACAMLELLAGSEEGGEGVIAVVSPSVLERIPDAYALGIGLDRDERGRWSVRRYPGGVPRIGLRTSALDG